MTDFLIRHFVRDYQQVQDPAVRERYGVLSGGVGIFLNLLLSLGKFFAGVVTGSIAVTADAFNNLSDAGSSVVTLVGFKLAGQKADDGHPFGHGRIEYLAGLLVSLLILMVGVELGKTSIEKIIQPQEVAFSILSVGILVCSILIKLWMSLFNRKLGKRIHSAAMQATATAHVSIDGWIGVVVAVFILRAGWGAAKDTLNPLLGTAPDPELVKAIQQLVLSHEQVVGMHDLVIHDYGPGRRMCSFHAEVPEGDDIMEAHDAIDHIEREIQEKFGIETTAHMDPIATGDSEVVRLREQMSELVREIDPDMSIHDFRLTRGPRHSNLIFDVVVPHRCRLSDEEIRRRITEAAEQVVPGCYVVLQLDRSYVGAR